MFVDLVNQDEDEEAAAAAAAAAVAGSETDWALVMRGIGAFVGIVFAIVSAWRPFPLSFSSPFPSFLSLEQRLTRLSLSFFQRKLPWTSTMQVSLTLALANPFLWYIVDRSKPGFWLSAAVGLVGSAVLTSLNPEMVPAPMTLGPGALFGNSSSRRLQQQQGSSSSVSGGPEPQATFETGIWMVSVLFCSCIFFGNIGRRLAVSKSSAARGRWGGVR
ncbi:hypothetical protein VTK73DRAFT_5273 [Phialemonium thermophilum]|uniref:Peptidase S54 rhomboid domain-containing protein n=1 Tax=Phialemonium thermophilum TaxID=223376 RepID=A0ABR3V3N5_9PEZI